MKKRILLVLVLFFGRLNAQTVDSLSADPSDLIGLEMPEFSATSISGTLFNAETLRGKVVVINFWFIGCLPCMKEIPYLNELHQKYKDEDFVLLSIAPHVAQDLIDFNSDSATAYSGIRKFLANAKIEYEIIAECQERTVTGGGTIGPDCNSISGLFNIKGFPTTVIVNKDGVVAYTTSGFAANIDMLEEEDDYEPGLSDVIDKLLIQNAANKN